MKKKLTVLLVAAAFLLAGCRKADRISYNISREADDMNIVRKVTVVNAIQGEILYQMQGKMSINDDGNQLEVIAEDEDGSYKKHIVGLSDNVTYVVEDITGKDVSDTKFTIVFNPDMIIPIDAKLAE